MVAEFVYFDIHGLGVMPRLVMAAGGVEFTDTRVTFPQWPELKKTMPLGQVPILKTDGLTINQSNAIINWAVRAGDLPKLSCEESSKSDMVAETCREVFDGVRIPAFAAMRAIDESKKEERSAAFRDTAKAKLLEQLPKLETILKHVGAGETGIAAGKITLGDLYLLNIGLLSYDLGTCDSVPKSVMAIAETLRKNDRIAAFFEKEKETKFFPF
ncbi:Oidioi.mRNA.OKI2018_I69.chr2.g4213.t1.cds [Oikopleura dioica]|uniref:glutathione transferase n=1 Tax=Oikopleura dioica TaxID=34765 RepID=A0ABN7T232_OIKDI|nr:Oidioi.mRNA.OKI2018_I69.chr2.g4213.t1.cds [Oikopleura dioica]